MNATADPLGPKERALFVQALERTTVEERTAFLDEACAGEPVLRRRLEALLKRSEQLDAFPEKSGVSGADQARQIVELGAAPTISAGPISEQPGNRIGRYKLLERIGEGGCGAVYMAEQEEPVRRRIALKVIKVGMDTRSVIARFEAERQALAMMDHPNIAKVHDAGASETGRPYFVMELVRGIKITEYCDQKNLSTQQRLDLFVKVCQAIQHAHQKGIIHRDIKPSNILVTVNDGVAVPKVIDFGIAKATTDQRLTDKTVFTAFEQFIGTPAYMSPEQAEITSVDIDTRSDIYSLGVLLYELLTGETPFDANELLKIGLDEMRRTIREKEPEPPSTRLTQELARQRVAASRQSAADSGEHDGGALPRRRYGQIQELIHLVRGDLDWIVMKCLEKDRARRYETANGLASDIQRHLDNEPVEARPPSPAYRFQKLVHRNKMAFAAASAVSAALLIGFGVSTWMFLRERGAKQEQERLRQEADASRNQAKADAKAAKTEAAKSRQVVQFFEDMLEGAGPEVAKGRDATILKEILNKTVQRISADLTNQPAVEADIRERVGNVDQTLGDYPAAELQQRRVIALQRQLHPDGHRDLAEALDHLAITLMLQGQLPEAESLGREAVSMGKKFPGPRPADLAVRLNDLATILKHEDKLADAETLYREALAINKRFLGNEHREVAVTLNNLAQVVGWQGKLGEAEQLMREALQMGRNLWGNEHPLVAKMLTSLTMLLLLERKLPDAETTGREAVAMQRRVSGPDHPDVAHALANLAEVLEKEENLPEAEAMYREALAIRQKALGNEHPMVAQSFELLGLLLNRRGNLVEAEAMLRESLAMTRKLPRNGFINVATVLVELATVLDAEGKSAEAQALREEAQATRKETNELKPKP